MCWKCSFVLKPQNAVSRSDVCPSCGADVHCCKNCRFYEPGSHYDCHETIEEPVFDKEKANFCDFFSLKEQNAATSSSAQKVQAARDAFASLFGN